MNAPAPQPLITDHAVLRYAERVLGMDVRAVVEHAVLGCDKRGGLIRRIHRGRIRLGDSDVMLVVERGQVVTVVVKQPGAHAAQRNHS
jgi:hypothetical protein